MLDQIREYRTDRIGLGALTESLRGLYVEADHHETVIRDQFEALWSPIDARHELRTALWAPAG